MSRALSQAAKLKPEIRLAQALSEFCGSLAEPRAREFKSLQTTSPPSAADIIRLTEEINRDGARNHRAWRPYATSMALFLERVQALSRVGDFLLGSAQNMMASGVWAAIKISLGVAIGSLAFFKRISELFLKIGKSSATTKDLVEVYPTNRDLQHLMCEYLITLVSFCQKIVLVSGKSTMLQLASPFIGFFDKEATKFEAEMSHWASMIDRKAMALLSRRQFEAADALSRIGRSVAKLISSEGSRQQDLALRYNCLQQRLCSRQLERSAAWRRQRRKGTTKWLLKERAYQQWKSAGGSSVLWVKGKLGSGKTVLLANIVADLYAARPPDSTTVDDVLIAHNPIIAYLFYNKEYSDADSYEIFMGSLFQQILAHLGPDHDSVVKMDEYFRGLFSPSLSVDPVDILCNTLPKSRPIFVILDALDECTGELASEVLGAIKSLSKACTIHFCCSNRTGAPVGSSLVSIFSNVDHEITLATETLQHDMREFVEAEFDRRRHVRVMDPSLEAIIKDVLIDASDGMFLWVALQVEALLPLHPTTLLSPGDILHSLQNLPKDLAEMFDRALGRIADNRYKNRIFQLVAAARRPLTLAELRIALHVEPGSRELNGITLPQDPSAVIALCTGSLLEVDEEDDTVRFIHHSVYQHLVLAAPLARHSPYRFPLGEADLFLGSICVTYLGFNIFNTSLATRPETTISGDQFVSGVLHGTSSENNIATKVIAAIKRKGATGATEINLGQLLQRCLQPAGTSEVLAFSAYAHEHWLWHTARFWPDERPPIYQLFLDLVTRTPAHVDVPWPTPRWEHRRLRPKDAIENSFRGKWARDNKHLGILLVFLSDSRINEITALYKEMLKALRSSEVSDVLGPTSLYLKVLREAFQRLDETQEGELRNLFIMGLRQDAANSDY